MNIARHLVVTLAACMLSACTFMYQRQYVAEPEEQLTAVEKRAAFDALRSFLVAKGLSPLPTREAGDPNFVAFKVGGGSTGVVTRTAFSDILELRFVEGQNVELRLLRIIKRPADFPETDLARFVSESELFIFQASSRKVRLKLLASDRGK